MEEDYRVTRLHGPTEPDGTGPGAAVGVDLGGGRGVLAAAGEVLAALPALLWRAPGGELGGLLGELDRVASLAAAGRVAVTAEALQRGEVGASQCASTAAWVGAHAPSLATGGAGAVAKLVEGTAGAVTAPVRAAVLAGRLPVAVALVVLGEFTRLRGRVVPEAAGAVLDGLIAIGTSHGARAVRMLRERLLAEHADPHERERAADRAARQVALSHPVPADQEGVWDYTLRVDAEAKAILEAAIGPLSAPCHPSDGDRDPRSAAQRRGQALVEVCRRVTILAKAAGPYGGHPTPQRPSGCASRQRPAGDTDPGELTAVDPGDTGSSDRGASDTGSSDPGSSDPGSSDTGSSDGDAGRPEWAERVVAGSDPAGGGGSDERWWDPPVVAAAVAGLGAGGAKATLMLTLAALRERIGAASVLGSPEADSLLTAGTARRIACDASIVPVVLGTDGELLELGRAARLFSPAQARAVLLRDRHCTFPGCDIPGFWTQLHHIRHWADGGPTDYANAALLCARHHTIVHRDRLTATVHPTGLHWDTSHGSYDHPPAPAPTPAPAPAPAPGAPTHEPTPPPDPNPLSSGTHSRPLGGGTGSTARHTGRWVCRRVRG